MLWAPNHYRQVVCSRSTRESTWNLQFWDTLPEVHQINWEFATRAPDRLFGISLPHNSCPTEHSQLDGWSCFIHTARPPEALRRAHCGAAIYSWPGIETKSNIANVFITELMARDPGGRARGRAGAKRHGRGRGGVVAMASHHDDIESWGEAMMRAMMCPKCRRRTTDSTNQHQKGCSGCMRWLCELVRLRGQLAQHMKTISLHEASN